MVLQSHYRNQLTFSMESLEGAENAYKKLKNKVLSLKQDEEVNTELKNKYINKFKECLENDLNTANALTLIYEELKENTTDTTKYMIIKSFDEVLSLDLTKKNETQVDEKYIEEMITKRNNAKENKDYKTADAIRDELLSKGIILKDTREGTIYEVNR